MRTANVNVQALLAQAQAKLSGTAQQASSSDKSSEAEKIGKISPVLAEVHERIAAQSQTASASLSALGTFKSNLFSLGTAAKDVAALPADSKPEAVKAALDKLVTAYNATLKSGAAVGSAGGDAGSGIGRAQRELRGAADGADAATGSLGRLGIARAQDGSLTLDAGALTKALANDPAAARDALATLAGSISGTATRTLADDGRLSNSLARLGQRAQALKDQQAAVVSTANQLASLNTAGSSWSAMALSAYKNA